MSVVAWDGKTLAADCQGMIGDMRVRTTKIFQRKSGAVMATVGDMAAGLELIQWFDQGHPYQAFPRDKEHEAVLIVAEGGRVRKCSGVPIWIDVCEPFMAWGSGKEFAMGAMAMGASAREAVEVACRFCVSCGIGVESFEASE